MRVFLTHMSLSAEPRCAQCEALESVEVKPGSAFVGASELLHQDLLIEIEATVSLGA